MAHVHGYPHNEEEWLDMILGRGAGDGDVHPSPAEQAASHPKAAPQNQDITTPAPTSQTSTTAGKKNSTGRKKKHL